MVTWAHPQVATQVAQWVSKKFAVQVSTWLIKLQTTGTVSINGEDTIENQVAPTPLTPEDKFSIEKQTMELQERKAALEKHTVEMKERIEKLEDSRISRFELCSRVAKCLDMTEDDRLKSIMQTGFLNAVTSASGGIPGGGGPVVASLTAAELDPLERESSVSLRAEEKYKLVLSPSVCSQVGKKLAAKFRLLHPGQEPPKRDQYVSGTLRKVKHYTEKDWQEFGDTVMSAYLTEKKLLK